MPKRQNNKLAHALIVSGILILALILLIWKNQSSLLKIEPAGAALQAKFEEALNKNRPVLAFYHSLDCIPCQEMMTAVAQVYPEFHDKIELIDVDVYDQRNEALLREASIHAIPTLIFHDRNGATEVFIGVMQVEKLRQTLAILAVEN